MSDPNLGETTKGIGDSLPAIPSVVHLPASILFGAIVEAPLAERKDLYTLARDATYLNFADNALTMSHDDQKSAEERVASLEFVGSSLHAFLPRSYFGVYATGIGGVEHTLNTAELAVRFAQIRSRGYQLVGSQSQKAHLQQAFPPMPLGIRTHDMWQWSSIEIATAKNTCLGFIDLKGLAAKDETAGMVTEMASKVAADADLLRAAQIYTEACVSQLFDDQHTANDTIDQEAAALAALRTPGRGRTLTDETMLRELNQLEIKLRATAIVRIGTPKYHLPKSLVEYGEFVFDPANCDENGVPNGLTPEEAEKVREKHLKNIGYMVKNARGGEEVRSEYATLLAKHQTQLQTPQQ